MLTHIYNIWLLSQTMLYTVFVITISVFCIILNPMGWFSDTIRAKSVSIGARHTRNGPLLLCMYICLASDFSRKFNIHFTWMWPRYIVIGFLIGGRKKLPLILVKFLTVQTVNMVNAWSLNAAVPHNSLFTRWHHLLH